LILWDICPRQENLYLLEDLLEGFGMLAEIGNHSGCALDLLVNLQDMLEMALTVDKVEKLTI
jgi:hypothetical protein